MTGGELSVTDAYGYPIKVASHVYRNKTYGGELNVSAGAITATCNKKGQGSFAIIARSMSNKPSNLKSIRGFLAKGASFVAGGNEYALTEVNIAKLVKYGANKTKAKLGETLRYCGASYFLRSVESGAFNTAAGRKLESLEFSGEINDFGPNAFANTKSHDA